MNIILKLALLVVLLETCISCGPRDYYTTTEPGPHGSLIVKKIPYTEKQREEQNALYYRTAPPAAPATFPTDPNLAKIQALWPDLTDSQRELLLQTAEQISQKH